MTPERPAAYLSNDLGRIAARVRGGFVAYDPKLVPPPCVLEAQIALQELLDLATERSCSRDPDCIRPQATNVAVQTVAPVYHVYTCNAIDTCWEIAGSPFGDEDTAFAAARAAMDSGASTVKVVEGLH